MKATSTFRLVGIEPDNLLGFLALLGALRSLEASNVAWRARVYWDVANPPVHPVFSVSMPVTQDELLDAIVGGCDTLAMDHDFEGHRSLSWESSYARKLLRDSVKPDTAARGRADVLAALISDAAVWKERVNATPLCMQFGQGHQHFLERFAVVPRLRAAPQREKSSDGVAPDARKAAELALFQPWQRVDMTPAFRWDPAEDRRYALRFRNPSVGGVPTVHGANRLAAVGLPVFTVVPRAAGRFVRLAMVGSRVNSRREVEISWPIWTRPASLRAVRALLNSPLFLEPKLDGARLAAMSIREVRRAVRIKVGEFFNVTRAEVVPIKPSEPARGVTFVA